MNLRALIEPNEVPQFTIVPKNPNIQVWYGQPIQFGFTAVDMDADELFYTDIYSDLFIDFELEFEFTCTQEGEILTCTVESNPIPPTALNGVYPFVVIIYDDNGGFDTLDFTFEVVDVDKPIHWELEYAVQVDVAKIIAAINEATDGGAGDFSGEDWGSYEEY